MRNPFICGVGGVVSADIAVPEHDRELAFYSNVLSTGENALWRKDLMNNLGMPIIGLGAKTPEYDFLPLQWMPHFQVADVADSVVAALELGGKELIHSKTEDGQSQWAGLTDANGCGFGVIPVVTDEPYTSTRDSRFGCIGWLSLCVEDATSSRDFYKRVVGWDARSVESVKSSAGYEMLTDSETAAAEIWENRSDANTIPAEWLLHLPVDDLAESLRRVDEFGGNVVAEFADEFAVVRDPIGVHFAMQSG